MLESVSEWVMLIVDCINIVVSAHVWSRPAGVGNSWQHGGVAATTAAERPGTGRPRIGSCTQPTGHVKQLDRLLCCPYFLSVIALSACQLSVITVCGQLCISPVNHLCVSCQSSLCSVVGHQLPPCFLPARRYAGAGYRDRNVSVRLSRAGIVSKRRKLAAWFLHHLVAPRL